jgi:feruloyl-CoA synthase
MTASQPRYRDTHVGGCLDATLETRADGTQILRSTEALGWHPENLGDLLAQWAGQAPDRTFAARRAALPDGSRGEWIHISYGQMLQRARAVGQKLVELGLSPERPVAILSDNDLEHLTIMMGAMWAGVPFVSVSSAYSLISTDFGKLRFILGTITPGLVYAADTRFARAIQTVVAPEATVVLGEGSIDGRATLPFAELLATVPGPEIDAAHARIRPETILKFLFTSGSTQQPKGVITTHRMLCANQQMLRQCMGFLADTPPVLVDWLPWSHTFGGNHNLGIVLYNGGTLYIDDGKPTPKGIAETIRNLREIATTVYFNVPKGLEEIARAMDSDAQLRQTFFAQVQAIMFAAAGLSQAVWDALDAHGEATVGERIRILTGLGMTETAPSCTFVVGTHARSGYIGLPCPGVEVKLVPMDGKTEVRFRGPNVMPGYWREPQKTAEAFDGEGFYCTGDAVKFVEAADLRLGLLFDGRIAEDFKLSTGTFVSVGPLRAKAIAYGHPCVQDVVVTGINRGEMGMMLFPRLADCQALAGLGAEASPVETLHHPAVRAFFQALCNRLAAEGTGSANRVARLHVLVEPPSIDHGEITDKSSINQRAVLTHRASLVEAMYQGPAADPWLILPAKG